MQRNIYGMILTVLLASSPSASWAYNLSVTIDTANLAGTQATLAFDFIDGDDVPNNTVELSGLQIDGYLDPDLMTLEGGVSLSDPGSATFTDSSVLNELLAPVTLGNWISFNLHSTSEHDVGSLLFDTFAFYILNGTGYQSLFATTDKNGADALFFIELGHGEGLSVCNPIAGPTTWAVEPLALPLPGSFALMIPPLLYGAWTNRRRFSLKA